ncbi:YbaB/EbfC family nucleoid-associated protein [Sphaerisporangium corydalis]|uniref:YbaB/EbfC family nucleoid-associated protein n=1 Tax=Sphaerisporangium corydalis TaxID=1441875 RepID=A0ABV9E5A0_9ACTN|nr:YbaB/EbfC family nucleoid-associated protein [Sphaerisporangium corydalis]
MFDPDGFRPEDLDQVAERSREAVRRLSGLVGELADLKGEGESAGGLIGAVVDGGGRIQEVTLDPRAMRMDSRTLAEAVTEAVRAAQEDAARASQELLREVVGEDAPSLDPGDTQAWLDDVARSMGEAWSPDTH